LRAGQRITSHWREELISFKDADTTLTYVTARQALSAASIEEN
jgi:hypothetical protein